VLWERRERTPPTLPISTYVLIAAALFAAKIAALWAIGRSLICGCGFLRLWHGEVGTPEDSQHFADWYSASHLIFGVGLYWVMWRTSRHWPLGWVFIVVIASSALWEIVENAPLVIERFGDTHLGRHYSGDSLVNSAGDTLFVLAGFVLARLLPVPASVALVVALELAAAWAVRDGLLLSLIMFVHPFAPIEAWQGQG